MWISILAKSLYAAFATILISSLFPVLPLDIGWQQRLITAVVNNTPLTLSALGLILLDHNLRRVQAPCPESDTPSDFMDGPTPEELRLWRLQRRCQRAAIGFLLVCLFQVVVSVRLFNQADRTLSQASQQLAKSANEAANALQTAQQPEQLNRVASLLLPPAQRQELQRLSILEQKTELGNRVNQKAREADLELRRTRNRSYAAITTDSLRNIALAVIFFVTFRRLKLTTIRL